MAKKDTSGGNGADNVIAFPNRSRPNYTFGKHWSSLKVDFTEIDLSGDPDSYVPEEFMANDAQFRIYFDSELARIGAKAFFGLANLSLAYLTEDRPQFDPVILTFEGQGGRDFVIGAIGDVVHFYFQISPEHGLMLQVQFPEGV